MLGPAPSSRAPSNRSTPQTPVWFDLVEKAFIGVLAGGLLSGFVLAAHVKGELSLLKSALLIFLGILTLLFGFLFLRAMYRGDVPQVESHWGGFGAGLGGWRMSQSLAYLLATVSFAGILVLAAGREYGPADVRGEATTKEAAAAKQPRVDEPAKAKQPPASPTESSGPDAKASGDKPSDTGSDPKAKD